VIPTALGCEPLSISAVALSLDHHIVDELQGSDAVPIVAEILTVLLLSLRPERPHDCRAGRSAASPCGDAPGLLTKHRRPGKLVVSDETRRTVLSGLTLQEGFQEDRTLPPQGAVGD
jgi:hypothetical protein